MAWNANSVSDYVLHRRRILVACFGLAGAVAVLSGVDLNEHVSTKQMFTVLYAVAMLAFFGHMAFREWRLMRSSAR